MKTYLSAKNTFTHLFFIAINIFLGYVLFLAIVSDVIEWIPLILIVFVILFLISIYFKTEYKLDEKYLYCRCSIFHSKIALKSIKKMEYYNKLVTPVIYKPALSNDGLIITFNKWDDIFISPINKEDFIKNIEKINPNIEISKIKK